MNFRNLSLIAAISLIPLVAHASNFAGPYAGVQLGQVRGHDDGYETFNGVRDGYSQNTAPKKTKLGIMGGYNWIIGEQLLLGADADLKLGSMSDTSDQAFGGVRQPVYPVTTGVKRALALRARVGYVFNEHRTMTYLALGLAHANITRTFGCVGCAVASQSSSEGKTGVTFGLGAEHFITDKTSLSVDYRYTKYGTSNVDTSVVYGAVSTEMQTYAEHSLLLGAAYHF